MILHKGAARSSEGEEVGKVWRDEHGKAGSSLSLFGQPPTSTDQPLQGSKHCQI